jgi:hypothetical protein
MIRWVVVRLLLATALAPTLSMAQTRAPEAERAGRSGWDGAPSSVRGREAWLEQRIRTDIADGALDGPRGRTALNELAHIRRVDAYYRSLHGYDLNDGQRSELQARLDDLRSKTP